VPITQATPHTGVRLVMPSSVTCGGTSPITKFPDALKGFIAMNLGGIATKNPTKLPASWSSSPTQTRAYITDQVHAVNGGFTCDGSRPVTLLDPAGQPAAASRTDGSAAPNPRSSA
jgi:hypothetical protein